MYQCIDYDDIFFYYPYSSFITSRKIDYYKIYSLSTNTYTYIVINRHNIQNAINKNNNLLKHLFSRQN